MAEEHRQEHTGQLLLAFLDAVVYGDEREEDSRAERAIATAASAVLKGTDSTFISEFGRLQSWTLFAVTGSQLAVRIGAGSEHGAPKTVLQHSVYGRAVKILEMYKEVVPNGSNVQSYSWVRTATRLNLT